MKDKPKLIVLKSQLIVACDDAPNRPLPRNSAATTIAFITIAISMVCHHPNWTIWNLFGITFLNLELFLELFLNQLFIVCLTSILFFGSETRSLLGRLSSLGSLPSGPWMRIIIIIIIIPDQNFEFLLWIKTLSTRQVLLFIFVIFWTNTEIPW